MTLPRFMVAADAAGLPTDAGCVHLDTVSPEIPADPERACVDCLREGTRWVHLRQCLECGDVHCCDNSPRRHATAHFRASSHPLIRSVESGEEWGWCYPDDLFLMPVGS